MRSGQWNISKRRDANVPGASCKGTGFNRIASDNQTLFIGPEVPQTVSDLISNPPDPSAIQDLSDLYDFFKEVKAAYDSVAVAYDNVDRTPSSPEQGTGFMWTTDGDRLGYADGFPDVLGGCTICISPIIILQHHLAGGSWNLLEVVMVR